MATLNLRVHAIRPAFFGGRVATAAAGAAALAMFPEIMIGIAGALTLLAALDGMEAAGRRLQAWRRTKQSEAQWRAFVAGDLARLWDYSEAERESREAALDTIDRSIVNIAQQGVETRKSAAAMARICASIVKELQRLNPAFETNEGEAPAAQPAPA